MSSRQSGRHSFLIFLKDYLQIVYDNFLINLNVEDEYVVLWAWNNGSQSFDKVIIEGREETLLIHVTQPDSDRIKQHGVCYE